MTYINEKGWGREIVFADEETYCGKLMQFDKKGNKFSMHYHAVKDETWYVSRGSFLLSVINTLNATVNHKVIQQGDTWRNAPLVPHQLEALEDDSEIIEVSTFDDANDNYRVFPGDSQTSQSSNS
jgi:quercetin dioxygenase-like cupin family protein